MQAPWEYFEYFSDLVYVSDIDTCELIYLNAHARALYGFSSHEEYLGKKCHCVVQHLAQPCHFCTHQKLLDEGTAEWTYRNPATAHTFRIKESLVMYNGRRCHVTLAIDMDSNKLETYRFNPFVHHESFVNECLMHAYAASEDPSESLGLMLQYIGTHQTCTQLHLYERTTDGLQFQSTCHWPPSTAASRSIPFDLAQYIKTRRKDHNDSEPLIFSDEQTLREQLPQLYAYLDSAEIRTLLLIPIIWQGNIGAYLRLDNTSPDSLYFLADICKVLSPFIVTTIQRRDLMQYFKHSSMYDQLTGAYNRHALSIYIETHFPLKSLGLVYCDVIGLKSINDLLGHAQGDQLIIKIFQILQASFPKNHIYRMGGDEFLVLCDNVAQQPFEQSIAHLRRAVASNGCELSVGSLWTDDQDKKILPLIQEVDNRMYQDKRNFYSQIDPATGQKRHTPQRGVPAPSPHLSQEQSAFQSFSENYFFDPDVFFRSVSMPDTTIYLYCGDMKKNIFFISDNLKDDFNFADNLVYNFISRLEQRIYKPDQDIHATEIQDIMENKREVHSIRYRIYNKSGQLVWVHCRGLMKWNESRTEPLFFSGSMICLKNEDAVDSTTGLLNLSSAMQELTSICNSPGHTQLLMLCFAFQPLADINLTFGRSTGDDVLQEIGAQLEIQMGTFFRFFRLSSTHFLAFSHKQIDPSHPVSRIRGIILDACLKHGIHVMYPCTTGVLHYPQDGHTPQELIDNAMIVANLSLEFPALNYLEFSSHMTKKRREQSYLSFALNYSVNHDFKGFHIVIQPQVISSTQRIFGGEVLLRWNEYGSELPLHKCISILEQQGMIIPVGKWIITEAARAAQRILAIKPDFRLSLNISYLQILDGTLFPFIEQTIRQYNIPPQNLLIELTETHSDTLPDHLERFIRSCRKLGISFVLDDFGTAYSSLSLLLQHPADLIKLDRTLMTEVTSSKQKFDFIVSIIYACHRFGKQVCIEGVETEAEYQMIKQAGCDLIQGFYFYRPHELNDLYRLLEQTENDMTE